MTPFVKGLIMTAVAVIAASLKAGIPNTPVEVEVFVLTIISTVLLYLGKNWIFPSDSLLGTIDLQDLVSGLFITIASGLSSYGASALTGTATDFTSILHLSLTVGVGYIIKDFASGFAGYTVPFSTTSTSTSTSTTKI